MRSRIQLSPKSTEDLVAELRKNHKRFKVTTNIHGDVTITFPEELTEEQVQNVKSAVEVKMPHMKMAKHEKVK